jgi:hypothetical protein
MKNEFYTSFRALLFAGILLFGAVYTGTNCPVTDLCCQTNDLLAWADTSFLPGTRTYDGKFPCSTTNNRDFCCTKRPCNAKVTPFLNTHFQNLSVALIVTDQKPQDRETLPGPVLDPHNTIPTVSIYTLTQSFRC